MNEMLFYGGIVLAACSAAVGLAAAVLFYISGVKLSYRFDEEYGKRPFKKK